LKPRRKWSHRFGVTGTVRAYATSHIGISQVGAPSWWSGSSDIVICDIPIGSKLLIVGTCVKGSLRIMVQRIGVLDDRERLYVGFAIHDIPTVTWECGTMGAGGVQVAPYRESGKGKFQDPNRRIEGG